MINAVIVGLGKIGAKYKSLNGISRNHVDALIKKKISLTALIDKSDKNFKQISKTFNLKKEKFYKLNKIPKNIKVDIVVLSTPPQNRYKLIKKISHKIKAKFYILEKPLCLSLKEAESINYFFKNKKKKVYVSYQRNWDKKTHIFLNRINKKNIDFITVTYSKGFLNNASHYLYEIMKLCGKIDFKSIKLNFYENKPFKNFSFFIKVGGIPVYFISNKYNKTKIEYQEMTVNCKNQVYELRSGGVVKKITTNKKNEIYPGYNFLKTKSYNFHIGPLDPLTNLYNDVKNIILKKKKYDRLNFLYSVEIIKLNKILENYAKIQTI